MVVGANYARRTGRSGDMIVGKHRLLYPSLFSFSSMESATELLNCVICTLLTRTMTDQEGPVSVFTI